MNYYDDCDDDGDDDGDGDRDGAGDGDGDDDGDDDGDGDVLFCFLLDTSTVGWVCFFETLPIMLHLHTAYYRTLPRQNKKYIVSTYLHCRVVHVYAMYVHDVMHTLIR